MEETIIHLKNTLESGKGNIILKWLKEFLSSEGGNKQLLKHIEDRIGLFSVDFREEELDKMVGLIGSEGTEGMLWTEPEEQWERRIESLVSAIVSGAYTPAPLILTNFWERTHTLADGNHRKQALLRLKRRSYWAIILTLHEVETIKKGNAIDETETCKIQESTRKAETNTELSEKAQMLLALEESAKLHQGTIDNEICKREFTTTSVISSL